MAYDNDALMAAAAQMLSMSGPSRQPVGLGQILGGGIGAYKSAELAAKQRKLEEDQARQMAEMRALQMQEMQGGLEDRSIKRNEVQRMAGLQQEFAARGAPQAPTAGGMEMPQAPGATPAKPKTPYQSAMEYAEFLQSKGEVQQAMAVAEDAQKLRPKVKELVKVRDGNSVKYQPIFDDGTPGDLLDREVAEKLMEVDRGGSVDLVDGFTGKAQTSLTKSVSPNTVYSANAVRANADATREVASATRYAADAKRMQDTEMKLADDYTAQSKGFKEVGDAYRTISTSLDKATTSPAATLASATKFMKLLDPGSVVRESELGMALAATGVFDRATNYYETLKRGKVLTPNQVKDFKSITEQIYTAAKQGQVEVDNSYRNRAKTYGLRPEVIIQDLGQNAKPAAPAASAIPAKAVSMLKMNPKLRAAFDEKYGAGAAASVLGK